MTLGMSNIFAHYKGLVGRKEIKDSPLQSYLDKEYPSLQLQINDPGALVHICEQGPLPPFGKHSLTSENQNCANICIFMHLNL